jgi:hypothetical protein
MLRTIVGRGFRGDMGRFNSIEYFVGRKAWARIVPCLVDLAFQKPRPFLDAHLMLFKQPQASPNDLTAEFRSLYPSPAEERVKKLAGKKMPSFGGPHFARSRVRS